MSYNLNAKSVGANRELWGVIFLLIFLCTVKLPAMLTADIQPWDEGLYAVRVNSIHINGDFIEQSAHSVGGFDSGSHPPLFIWFGYFATSIFGMDEFVFKLIPFIFGLLCVVFVIKMGELLYDFKTGFLSAMIFSATYLFTIYAKRFQFDMAVTFFIILSFYFLLLYFKHDKSKYFYFAAVSFGLCLLTKSLVGLFIPIILFVFILISGKNFSRLNFRRLLVFTVIGITIALPWYIYMVSLYGTGFVEFLFRFHIVERAITGVDEYARPTSTFYYASILFNNIPFGILLFGSFVEALFSFKKIDWKKLFLWSWFLAGAIIISLFVTKIETYLVPFLAPACLLISVFIRSGRERSSKEKFFIIILVLFNLFWFFTPSVRIEIKSFFASLDFFELAIGLLGTCIAIAFSYYVLKNVLWKFDLKKLFTYAVFIFFFGSNIFYVFNIPIFEDGFKLSEIKKLSDNSGRKKIVYVSSDFKFNPQFSYYFDGVDLGWKGEYEYRLFDLKDGVDNLNQKLNELNQGEYIILVEKNNINPGEYHETDLFMPGSATLIKKTHGYEMYLY